ncbi:ATP-binding cassette domain-containing protein [Rhodococcus qingshengii]|uniref:ATP-binding cassette domain-containing protein n=1 Tax=Rhodococcus qingshengii TaxID=334542 RepID=UPI0010A656AB|nr:ATP-binding cassette domain-containing protein [Rhodococcus qingshengii]THJ67624.1 ATP-binding cassette domain-containing protein [Rhodococcus qingshengii]
MSILLTTETALRVHDLRIVNEVDVAGLVGGVDFELRRGEVLGIVGESGSGKSISLRAVLGLLPAGPAISSGTIELLGDDTSRFTGVDWNRVRGSGITAVFQDPDSYLNPSIPVRKQVAEVLRVKRGLGRRAAKAQVHTCDGPSASSSGLTFAGCVASRRRSRFRLASEAMRYIDEVEHQ